MLVISRRKGQRIVIGDDIEIVVTEIHRSSVKIGVSAPRGYTVLRNEVRDSILEENRRAAQSSMEQAAALAESLPRGAAPTILGSTRGAARQTDGAADSQTQDADTQSGETDPLGPHSPAGVP